MGFTQSFNLQVAMINITTLATFKVDLGKKCFAFTKLDAGEIARIKKAAFGTETGKGKGK